MTERYAHLVAGQSAVFAHLLSAGGAGAVIDSESRCKRAPGGPETTESPLTNRN